jgi:hypothetical protein
MSYTVHIWLNRNERESFHRGWQKRDKMEWVSTVPFEGDKPYENIAEEAFLVNQHTDGVSRFWYEGRSFSVGDVVVVEKDEGRCALAVERVGFRDITEEFPHGP